MTLGAVCQNAVILLAFDLQFSHTGFVFRFLLYLLTQRAALHLRQNELSHLRGRDEALFQTGQDLWSENILIGQRICSKASQKVFWKSEFKHSAV